MLGISNTISAFFDYPNITERQLIRGVSFASAGSGLDETTNESQVVKGCCGNGTLEYGETFNGKELCANPKSYLFFDDVHPLEKIFDVADGFGVGMVVSVMDAHKMEIYDVRLTKQQKQELNTK
ncbi:hypothetical protein IEQ34_017596 [Dendrobium chrysotoxum]|uniref:Uncharacterized protein n=1 Tax=Dendrobium chrysotoxum TaxID=161865 RepID=A0AAV7GCJ6_DENCH|nr:hypothetical protein IEQ34_017596 [Dendrobium chrysotoxum]